MNNSLQTDTWSIVDDAFDAGQQLNFENLYALGNGYIHQLANFEEFYSGETSIGTTINGIVLSTNQNSPISESTETNKKKINAPNWTGIAVRMNEEVVDLNKWEIQNFRRELNMKDGILDRFFEVTSPKGYQIQVTVKRFVSLDSKAIGTISYKVKSINFDGRISFMPLIDGNILNDIGEPLWNVLQVRTDFDVAYLWLQIRKMESQICTAMAYEFFKNNEIFKVIPAKIEKEKQVGYSVGCEVKKGESVMLNKYVAIVDSLNYPNLLLSELACKFVLDAKTMSWKVLLEKHKTQWNEVWAIWESQQTNNVKVSSLDLQHYFNKIQNATFQK